MNDLMDGLIQDMSTGTYTTKRPYPATRFVKFNLIQSVKSCALRDDVKPCRFLRLQ